jgi:hypothetical protein
VVGDLMQIMTTGISYPQPIFEKRDTLADFEEFECEHYLAFEKTDYEKLGAAIPTSKVIESNGEIALITKKISERELAKKLSELHASPLSDIRVLS